MVELSIISPVYRAEQMVDLLVDKILIAAQKVTDAFEIILVEDGSPDNSWEKIEENCKKDKRIKGVKLSRNFGQHYAITAGLNIASGKLISILDCDLQDDPEDIARLINKHKEGYDIIFTRRKKRRHSFLKLLTARIYNAVFSLFADSKYDINAGSLVLFTHKVKEEFLKVTDQDRLYIQILKWVGFKSAYLEVEHNERHSGESSYTISQLFKIAVQGWTFHSDKLLRLSIYIGFSFAMIAFFYGGYIILRYFLHAYKSGWASTVVLILFSSGLLQISIGIAGIYIGKIFKQSKNRPLFIIEKRVNDD